MVEKLDYIIDTPNHVRNFPASPLSVTQIREAAYYRDDLWFPSVVARRSAITHNLRRFAQWCRERGVELAPHGKTSMSPQLWHAQLEQGAWGITAATVSQARTMYEAGVRRSIIANEVLDPAQARWVAETNAEDGTDYYTLVDSSSSIQLLDKAGRAANTKIPVFIEFGVVGRRTGVRSVEQGLALAQEVLDTSHLTLTGVEGYEGVLPAQRSDYAVAAVSEWLAVFVDFIRTLDDGGFFRGTDEILLSAGGSAFPDIAVERLTEMAPLSRPFHTIIRAGCYITHDHQSYERSSPLRSEADENPLVPALTCFARVNSVPEPGRALLTVGKRDVPSDVDMPMVLYVEDSEGNPRSAAQLTVTELNDHHAFVTDPGEALRPGDLVELGLSHPCTTFDKWPLIPVLDDEDQVVDAIRTLF